MYLKTANQNRDITVSISAKEYQFKNYPFSSKLGQIRLLGFGFLVIYRTFYFGVFFDLFFKHA